MMILMLRVMAILTLSLETPDFAAQTPSTMATSLASVAIEGLKCEEVKSEEAIYTLT